MKCVLKLVLLFGTCLPFISTRRVEFYRKDYKYFAKFDAFYKMHWDADQRSLSSAILACDDEGATLFNPKLENEWILATVLRDTLKSRPNVTEIFVGIHDMYDIGKFTTVDGHPYIFNPEIQNSVENCVTMDIDSGVYKVAPCVRFHDTPLPFICKKNDVEYCPTIDPGYEYVEILRKCYKINKNKKTWNEALRTCYMEGGILVVLQNYVEADKISKLIKSDDHYHTGLRRIYVGRDFYTVTGQNIGDVYQRRYLDREAKYDCNTIFKLDNVIFMNDSDCNTELPFICEMDIQ